MRPEPATRSFTGCDTITTLGAANAADASANVHRESLEQLVLVRIQAGQHRPDALLIVGAYGMLPGMDKSDPSYKGQSGYNAAMLAIYDVWVLKFMTKAVWKVPVAQGVDRYRQHMGHRHLDVGPGTGYFIEKADPPRDTEITLLDPNQTVLRHVAKRLEERHPITVEADVMKPLPVDGPFDSAALSFVLHCLRGPEGNKAVAVRNIADVLSPEGVLFGGTVLGLQSNHTKPARAFLRAANKQGAFDNVDDTAEGLRRILEMSFSAVDVDVVGSAALFAAARHRSGS